MSLKPSDLFLSPDLTEDQALAFLESIGFRDPAAADRLLQSMAEDLGVRLALGEIADALVDGLSRVADRDAALAGLCAYLDTRASKVTFLNHLRDDQKALDVCLEVFGTSELLGEMLIKDPHHFPWLMARIDRRPSMTIDDEEIEAAASGTVAFDLAVWERLHRQQLLRIGVRDILGRETAESVAAQLAHLIELTGQHVTDSTLREQLIVEGEQLREFLDARRRSRG